MTKEGGQSTEFNNNGEKVPPTILTGAPLGMYNSLGKIEGGKDSTAVPIIHIALRIATIIFCIVSFVILTSDHEGETNYCDFGSDDYCWFSWKAVDSSNMAYLLAINVVVCFYSIIQLVLSIKSVCNGKPMLARPTSSSSTITLVCDKIFTYILMAGCGAGAFNVANTKNEEDSGKGVIICSDGLAIFCNKEVASIVMSFISFLATAFSAGLAYFRVHRVAKVVNSSRPHLLPMSHSNKL